MKEHKGEHNMYEYTQEQLQFLAHELIAKLQDEQFVEQMYKRNATAFGTEETTITATDVFEQAAVINVQGKKLKWGNFNEAKIGVDADIVELNIKFHADLIVDLLEAFNGNPNLMK